MSILWEEEGFEEVFQTGWRQPAGRGAVLPGDDQPGGGTPDLQFPELTLSLLAVILLLGKYTGYRLSELYRFRDLDKPA